MSNSKHTYRDARGRFARRPSMHARLIKSSIYRASGKLARFTGDYSNGVPVFSAHGERFASLQVATVERDAVMAYLGR